MALFAAAKIYPGAFDYRWKDVVLEKPYYDMASNKDDVSAVKELRVRPTFRSDVDCSFDFRLPAQGLRSDYENMFQTADVNSGMRLEVAKGSGAVGLVFNKMIGGVKSMSAINLSDLAPMTPGIDHHISIHVEKGTLLTVTVDGHSASQKLGPECLEVSRVLVGQGFDESRKFSGLIKKFSFKARCFYPAPPIYGMMWREAGEIAGYVALVLWCFLSFFVISNGVKGGRVVGLGYSLLMLVLLFVFSIVKLYPTAFEFRAVPVRLQNALYDYGSTRPEEREVKSLYVNAPDKSDIEISFTFRLPVDGLKAEYEDLLQTADVNSGMRMEASASTGKVSMLFNNKVDEKRFLRSVTLNDLIEIKKGQDYRVKIRVREGSQITLSVNGKATRQNVESAKIKLSHIAVGQGFDSTRRFSGVIKDFDLNATAYYLAPPYHGHLWIMLGEASGILLALSCIMVVLVSLVYGIYDKARILGALYLVVYALYWVLHIYSLNTNEVTFHEFLIVAFYGSLAWLVLYLTIVPTVRSSDSGMVLMLIIFLVSMNAGRIYEYVSGLNDGLKPGIFVLLCLLFMIILWLTFRRSNWSGAKVTKAIGIVGGVLLVMSLVDFTVNSGMMTRLFSFGEKFSRKNDQRSVVSEKESGPDIYYIILDAYANNWTLKKYFNYDNSAALEKYQKLGFRIAKHSVCNYRMTRLSLASSLNMDYLDRARYSKDGQLKSVAERYLADIYLDNRVMRYLHDRGYKIVCITPERPITQRSFTLYTDLSSKRGGGFLYSVLDSSILFWNSQNMGASDKQTKVLSAFRTLKESVGIPGPKFVHMHVVVPHWRYVFDKDGKLPATVSEQNDFVKTERNMIVSELNKRSYLNQLNYVTEKMYTLVDYIIKNSKRDPVIIIQSDHGPYLIQRPDDYYAGSAYPEDILKARYRNFEMFHIPADIQIGIYDDITPVNIFPVVFNGCFGDSIRLKPDKAYFYPNEGDYFAEQEVTQKVIFSTAEKK
jgi:hypothetical protein